VGQASRLPAPDVERRIALKSKSGVTTTAVSLKDYRIHDKIPSATVG
jgi:hypothetical protein